MVTSRVSSYENSFVQNSSKNINRTVHPRYKTPTGELKHCIDIDECSYEEACPRYSISDSFQLKLVFENFV